MCNRKIGSLTEQPSVAGMTCLSQSWYTADAKSRHLQHCLRIWELTKKIDGRIIEEFTDAVI